MLLIYYQRRGALRCDKSSSSIEGRCDGPLIYQNDECPARAKNRPAGSMQIEFEMRIHFGWCVTSLSAPMTVAIVCDVRSCSTETQLVLLFAMPFVIQRHNYLTINRAEKLPTNCFCSKRKIEFESLLAVLHFV